MTERWQRELKKLGGVDVPVSRMRAQMANGPTEDPPQPVPSRSPSQRITAGVVAFAVFAAAGVFAYKALKPNDAVPGGQISPTPSDEPAASDVVRLNISTTDGRIGCPGSPQATITYGNQSTKGALTSYTWNCPGSSMVADTVTPSFSAGDFVQAPVGIHLSVTGDSSAAEGALQTFEGEYPWPTAHDLGDLAASPDLSFEPGRYVIEVIAHWPNGTLHFYFPIELVLSVTSSNVIVPDVLKVSCDGGAPQVATLSVAARTDGVHVELVGNPPPGTGIAAFGRRDGSIYLSRGDDATQGLVWQLGTGTYDVKCYQVGAEAAAAINAADSVEIVDPNGNWISTYLACPFSGQVDVSPRGFVPGDSAEASIRAAVSGLLPSDVIERAGYAHGSELVYRVVRRGSTIAALTMGKDAIASNVVCNDAGLG